MGVIRDIMTRDLTAVEETCTMLELSRILALSRLSGLPVVSSDNRVVGFISDNDVLISEFPQRINSIGRYKLEDFLRLARQLDYVGESKVINFMSTPPVTLEEDDPIESSVRLILEKNLKIIPVVRNGILMGVVERINICKHLMEKNTDI